MRSFVLARILALFIIFIVLNGCKKENAPLRLATYTYSTNNRIDNLKPLSMDLEDLLNRKVEIKSYPDVASFIVGIKANEVDVALINTLGYLILAQENDNMHPIAALKVTEDAKDNYKSVLLSSNDSITNLEDLVGNAAGLKMMFVNRGSTSGNLIPRLLLSSLGIKKPEKTFKTVEYGGDHTKTFKMLLSKKTDIGVIGSNEYYKQISLDSTVLDSVNTLWISQEIPLGPVLLNNGLSDKDREEITELFLTLHDRTPSTLESIKGGWSEAKQTDRFYPIDDTYYDAFRMLEGNNTNLIDILQDFR